MNEMKRRYREHDSLSSLGSTEDYFMYDDDFCDKIVYFHSYFLLSINTRISSCLLTLVFPLVY
jgi:hypothetical protein